MARGHKMQSESAGVSSAVTFVVIEHGCTIMDEVCDGWIGRRKRLCAIKVFKMLYVWCIGIDNMKWLNSRATKRQPVRQNSPKLYT